MNSDAIIKLHKFKHFLDVSDGDIIPEPGQDYTLLVKVSLKDTIKSADSDQITFILAQSGGCNLIK